MLIKVHRIQQILDVTPENALALTITPTQSTTITMYQGRVVKNELSRYSMYYITNFTAKWRYFVEEYTDNLYKMWSAINTDYNPINNYDMSEHSVDTNLEGDTIDVHHKGTKNNDGTWTDSKVTSETNLSQTAVSSSYTSTYDDGLKLVSQTTTRDDGINSNGQPSSQSATNTVTYNDDYTNTRSHDTVTYDDNGNTVVGDNISTHKLTRSGNIGVTTTQQMIDSELTLRYKSLLEWFISKFIERYCWYAGSDDICIEVDTNDNIV